MSAKSIGRILFFVLFAILMAFVIIYFTRPNYPIQRIIKNTDGKSVDAVITGKIGDTIYFDRLPDKTSFSLPLDRLAFRDRALLTILKEQAPPAPPPPPEPVVEEFEDDYIRNRIELIDELEAKREVMQIELDSKTLSKAIHADYARRIAKIDLEIKTLEVAIETHRYRLKKE